MTTLDQPAKSQTPEHSPAESLSLRLQDEVRAAQALPDSFADRARIVMQEAGKAVLPAVKDAWLGFDDLHIPMSKTLTGKDLSLPVPKIVESTAFGVAVGYAAEKIIQSTGIPGKVGAAVVAGVFAIPVAAAGYDIYRNVNGARTLPELRQAGRQLGTTAGTLAANLPVGYASYEAGAFASRAVTALKSVDGMIAAGSLGMAPNPKWEIYNRLPLD
jgi:hypothetical protein